MSRYLLARLLEPLVAISWGLLMAWSIWLAAVWALGINQQWLGLPAGNPMGWESGPILMEDTPPPKHADLRRAILLMANHAELGWFALALIQVHLHVVRANGVNTARVWLGIAFGGAFLLASVNRYFGMPFGHLYLTRILGAQFFGVPLGWVLLWAVLLIGGREAVLRLRPRASHVAVTSLGALLALLTIANLNFIALDMRRPWWFWHTGNLLHSASTPWWFWPAWFAMAWALLFLMRERSVTAAAARRSAKPLILIGVLNACALVAHAFRA